MNVKTFGPVLWSIYAMVNAKTSQSHATILASNQMKYLAVEDALI
jgi:hypothetical protein